MRPIEEANSEICMYCRETFYAPPGADPIKWHWEATYDDEPNGCGYRASKSEEEKGQ